MPMLDAFVPDGALSADAERELLSRLTDILLRNEGADPTPEGQYDDKRRQAMVEQVTEAVLDLPPGSASSEDAQADSVAARDSALISVGPPGVTVLTEALLDEDSHVHYRHRCCGGSRSFAEPAFSVLLTGLLEMAQSSGHRQEDGSERPEPSTEVESEQPAG